MRPPLLRSPPCVDVLEEVLRQHAYTPPNVHIAANKMRFDRHGVLAGFEDPCFHVFNKEASAVRGEPYFADIRRRRHVLLLGDNLGDLKMSHGAGLAVPGLAAAPAAVGASAASRVPPLSLCLAQAWTRRRCSASAS